MKAISEQKLNWLEVELGEAAQVYQGSKIGLSCMDVKMLIESYREAITQLKFYAGRENWKDKVRRWGTGQCQSEVILAPAKDDEGQKARDFLEVE